MLRHEIDRPSFDLRENLADIFAHDSDHQELYTADYHQADNQRGIARHGTLVHECFDQHPTAEHERARTIEGVEYRKVERVALRAHQR